MKLHNSLSILAGLAMAGMASATTIGLPGGEFAATWDTFSAVSFTGDAPDSSTAALTGTLDSYSTGILPTTTPAGDRIYSLDTGNPPSMAGSFNFDLRGTTTTAISQLSLVLKFTAPNLVPSDEFFSLSLDGVNFLNSATPTHLGDVTEGSNTFGIYSWTFSGLESGESFIISISSPANHVALDAIQLVVPEPGSAMLGLLGAGLMLKRRRK